MVNFLNYPAKNNKKLVIFFVVFFVLAGILLPHSLEVRAQAGPPPTPPPAPIPVETPPAEEDCSGFFDCSVEYILAGLKDFFLPVIEFPALIVGNIILSIQTALVTILYFIGYYFAWMTSWIFFLVSYFFIKDTEGTMAITRIDGVLGFAFVNAWAQVKVYANMLLVLGFIGVALAYILSLNQYKKLLVPLLITALLVNFSGLFVGLIIDASNILMLDFLGATDTNHFGVGLVQKLDATWQTLSFSPDIKVEQDTLELGTIFAQQASFIGMSFVFFYTYMILGITLLMMSLVFIVRYVNLAICFIFAPIAFVLRVFPFGAAQKLWDDWLKRFLKWSFIGVITCFFLNLSVSMFDAAQGMVKTDVFKEMGIFSKVASLQFSFLIALCFMWFGFMAARKSSQPIVDAIMKGIAVGAQVVMAYFTGGATLAGGLAGAAKGGAAAAGAAKGAGAMARARAALGGAATGGLEGARGGAAEAKNIRDRASDTLTGSRAANWIRDTFQGAGTSSQRQQKIMKQRLDSSKARISTLKDDDIISQMEKGVTPQDRAAATDIARERKILHKADKSALKGNIESLMNNYDPKLSLGDFTKVDHRVAGLEIGAKNKESIERTEQRIQNKIIADGGPALPPNILRQRAESQLEEQQLIENLSDYSLKQLHAIKPAMLTNKVVENMTPNIIKKFSIADDTLIASIKNNLIEKHLGKQRTVAIADGRKSDANKLTNLIRAINDLPRDTAARNSEGAGGDRDISNSGGSKNNPIKNSGGDNQRNFPPLEVDEDTWKITGTLPADKDVKNITAKKP